MDPEQILDVITNMSDFILKYAIVLAAVGALTMALVEAYKSLFKTREKYHMRILYKWVAASPIPWKTIEKLHLTLKEKNFHESVYRQIIHLTTGVSAERPELSYELERGLFTLSPENALFALELEKMMGQIQDAADMALSNPTIYPELYLLLTVGANPVDVENWYHWSVLPPTTVSEEKEKAKAQADTYSRLHQIMRRHLDGLQLTASYRWKQLNQFYAVLIGAVLLFIGLISIEWGTDALDKGGTWIKIVLASLIGGMVAPVAKDLVVALKKVRGGG